MPEHGNHTKTCERERKRAYRNAHRTFQLTVPLEEAQRIENSATSIGYTPREFILELLLAHETNSHVSLPPNEQVRQLIFELKRIGTNVNQAMRYANTHRELKPEAFTELQSLLAEVEEMVLQTLIHPKPITDIISMHLQEHPDDIEKIQQVLNTYRL